MPPSASLLILLIVSSEAVTQIRTIIKNLDDSFDYALSNFRNVDIDAFFGLVIAQAHLGYISQTQHSNAALTRAIIRLRNKGIKVYTRTRAVMLKVRSNLSKFVQVNLNPNLWRRQIRFGAQRLTNFNGTRLLNPKLSFKMGYLKHLSDQTLEPTVSNKCFAQVMGNNRCSINRECKSMMLGNKKFDSYYGTLNRLVYLEVARIQNCQLGNNLYFRKVASSCSYMLWEARVNARLGFIPQLDELLLLQMTMCGYHGFTEFLGPRLQEHVFEMKKWNGCFMEETIVDQKKKYNCSYNQTAFGIATLALMLRYQLN